MCTLRRYFFHTNNFQKSDDIYYAMDGTEFQGLKIWCHFSFICMFYVVILKIM